MLDNLRYFIFDVSVNDLHKLHFVPLLIPKSAPSQDSTTYLAGNLKRSYYKPCLSQYLTTTGQSQHRLDQQSTNFKNFCVRNPQVSDHVSSLKACLTKVSANLHNFHFEASADMFKQLPSRWCLPV